MPFFIKGDKMQNNTLYDALEYKMNRAEKRLANAQYNVWLYRSALEMASKNNPKIMPRKRKLEQLEMFSA